MENLVLELAFICVMCMTYVYETRTYAVEPARPRVQVSTDLE
jgi:hypothetical protein